jgi:hypothetical protein
MPSFGHHQPLVFMKTQLLAFIERYNPTAKPFAWTYQGKPLTK